MGLYDQTLYGMCIMINQPILWFQLIDYLREKSLAIEIWGQQQTGGAGAASIRYSRKVTEWTAMNTLFPMSFRIIFKHHMTSVTITKEGI